MNKAGAAPRLSHNVYVVELDPAVLKLRRFRARNPGYRKGLPCVYVGTDSSGVRPHFFA